MLSNTLPVKALNTTEAEFENTVDPDETALNEKIHLDLQCLPSNPLIFNIFTASNRYPGKEVVTPDYGSFHAGLRLFLTVSQPF